MQTRLTTHLDSLFATVSTMKERRRVVSDYIDRMGLGVDGEIVPLYSDINDSCRDICMLKSGQKLYWAGTMAGYRIGGNHG